MVTSYLSVFISVRVNRSTRCSWSVWGKPPLSNQNFLVVPAGNGATASTCPGDDTNTPYVDGTTVLHQPAPSP